MNIYLHQPLLSRRDKIRRKMGYPDIGTVNCLFTTTKFIRLDIWGMTFLFPYQKVSQSRVFIRTNLTSRPNWIDYPQKRVKSQYWRWVLSTNLIDQGHIFLQIPLLKTHLNIPSLIMWKQVFEKTHFSKNSSKTHFL